LPLHDYQRLRQLSRGVRTKARRAPTS
jgi:hypothetical protein